MGKIVCQCKKCTLHLSANVIRGRILCACNDCKKVLDWSSLKKGTTHSGLAKPIFVDSDIIELEGRSHIGAFKVSKESDTERLYCKECYSILGTSHPSHNNNTFHFFEGQCETDLNIEQTPCVAIFLSDWEDSENISLPKNIPTFETLSSEKDIERFFSIEKIQEIWMKEQSPKGKTFNAVFAEFEDCLFLN